MHLPRAGNANLTGHREHVAGRSRPCEAGENGAHALRIGLMQVKGLRVETIMAILRMRDEAGAFRSLEDFLHRVTVERDEIQALIKCGAFDEVCNMTRPTMLWRWNFLQAGGKKARSGPAGRV